MIPARPIAPLAVGDHEHPLVQLPLEVVDRQQPLPRSPAAHDDLAAGDRIGVVGVHRLPELVHDVVRDVHDRADRAHAGRDQPALHPLRRWAVGDAVEPARREARVELGLLDPDADVGRGVVIGLDNGGVRESQRDPGEGGDLACQADHAQGVAPVRLDVDVEHRLADQVRQRRAERDTRRRAPRMWMPSASVPRPSSAALHSIPWLTSPRIFVRSMRRSPGSTAPTSAVGTSWPASRFCGAAHDRRARRRRSPRRLAPATACRRSGGA